MRTLCDRPCSMAVKNIDVQLIVGLGNPGADYVITRHNAGFWFVDALADRLGARWKDERKFHGQVARAKLDGHDLRLLKPETFMNRSGLAVQALASYLKIPPQAVLVAHDEIDLPAGEVKLKFGGGHAGHNGLRDIASHIGADFGRLRIGVGRPKGETIDYVLGRPSRADEDAIIGALREGLDVLPTLLDQGYEKAMTRLHTRAGTSTTAD